MENQAREFIDKLKALHYQMKELLDKPDFEGAKKLLNEYACIDKDVNEMKTLLIITKGFKNHPTLSESRNKLLLMFNSKMSEKLKPKVFYNSLEIKEGKSSDPI